jgi:hypothetical protein
MGPLKLSITSTGYITVLFRSAKESLNPCPEQTSTNGFASERKSPHQPSLTSCTLPVQEYTYLSPKKWNHNHVHSTVFAADTLTFIAFATQSNGGMEKKEGQTRVPVGSEGTDRPYGTPKTPLPIAGNYRLHYFDPASASPFSAPSSSI